MDKEVWLESDLYIFQGDKNKKIREFFDSVSKFYTSRKVERCGLSLCVGWLRDSILMFNGDFNSVIPTCQAPTYEPWTYKEFGDIIFKLKSAAKERGIENFNVVIQFIGGATMAYDAENTCEGWVGRTEEPENKAHYNIEGKWFYNHPEINTQKYNCYFLGSKLNLPKEEKVLDEENPFFWKHFAHKIVAFAKATNLDGAVFRDHFFTPSYIRGNRTRYMDYLAIKENTEMFINLFKEIKSLNPNFINIGYNSGSSPIEEFRSHGFDLETVALSGYLDIFITQTWASAWQDYWPANSMGYSFQMQYALCNQAILSKTKCKHIFVIETFDAWEPWDSIHQFESKVKWEIWAYSHVQCKMKGGEIKHPDGCYISWMNRGKKIIDENAVEAINKTLIDCCNSLNALPSALGAAIIYDFNSLKKSVENGKNLSYSKGEEIDDWCAMVQKYSCPIGSSILADEFCDYSLKEIDELSKTNQFLIYPQPSNVSDKIINALKEFIKKGSIIFTGQVSSFDKKILNEFKIDFHKPFENKFSFLSAKVSDSVAEDINGLGFTVNQKQQSFKNNGNFEELVFVESGAILAKSKQENIYIWETPEWGTPFDLHLFLESIGDYRLFQIVSNLLKKNNKFEVFPLDSKKPMNVVCWEYKNGDLGALFGNLETGVTGSSQFAIKAKLKGSFLSSHDVSALKLKGGYLKNIDNDLLIALTGHKCFKLDFKINK